MYRRAMQLVPDIESRVPELREMKRTYRRRRRASSGGSTSEPEAANNAETKEQSKRDEVAKEEKQETIVEEETATTHNTASGKIVHGLYVLNFGDVVDCDLISFN